MLPRSRCRSPSPGASLRFLPVEDAAEDTIGWLLMCGCMCGGVYVSQLLPFTAGLAGSMQEYEVWLGVWRGSSSLNEQSTLPTSENPKLPTWTGKLALILKLGMAGRL